MRASGRVTSKSVKQNQDKFFFFFFKWKTKEETEQPVQPDLRYRQFGVNGCCYAQENQLLLVSTGAAPLHPGLGGMNLSLRIRAKPKKKHLLEQKQTNNKNKKQT